MHFSHSHSHQLHSVDLCSIIFTEHILQRQSVIQPFAFCVNGVHSTLLDPEVAPLPGYSCAKRERSSETNGSLRPNGVCGDAKDLLSSSSERTDERPQT